MPGRRPWLLSPEQVALAFARAEMHFLDPVTRRIAPATYDVGPRNSEWAATLHLAQPVRRGGGVMLDDGHGQIASPPELLA